MDTKYFIANWKSNKKKSEALDFLNFLKDNIKSVDLTGKEVIVAPPYTLLDACKEFIDSNSLPVTLSSQNVSSYPSGAYTGEINAQQLKEFVSYVIIGHSERLKYLHEQDNDLENKVREALQEGLKVVQCIQNEESRVHKGAELIAYEPPSAIGSGDPDDPEHIAQVFRVITEQNPDVKVLYGGSVKPENINQFMSIEKLSGFLIGGASLDAKSFLSLLNG